MKRSFLSLNPGISGVPAGSRAPRALFLAALFLSLLFGSSACRSSSSRGSAQNTYMGRDAAGALEVEESFGDPSLARQLVLEEIRTDRREDRLHVQFNLKNKKTSDLAIEWAIEWFDSAGFRIDVPHNWKATKLVGQGFETIARTAPTPEAAGFRLGVRKHRR